MAVGKSNAQFRVYIEASEKAFVVQHDNGANCAELNSDFKGFDEGIVLNLHEVKRLQIICPVEETGRNSVIPSIIARIMV